MVAGAGGARAAGSYRPACSPNLLLAGVGYAKEVKEAKVMARRGASDTDAARRQREKLWEGGTVPPPVPFPWSNGWPVDCICLCPGIGTNRGTFWAEWGVHREKLWRPSLPWEGCSTTGPSYFTMVSGHVHSDLNTGHVAVEPQATVKWLRVRETSPSLSHLLRRAETL